jgi:hypothetical protein
MVRGRAGLVGGRGRGRLGHGLEQEPPVLDGLPRPRPGRYGRDLEGGSGGGDREAGELGHVQLGDVRQLLELHPVGGVDVALGLASARHALGERARQFDAGTAWRRATHELEQVTEDLLQEVAARARTRECHSWHRRRHRRGSVPGACPDQPGVSAGGPRVSAGRASAGAQGESANFTERRESPDPRWTSSCTVVPGATV